MPLSFTNSCIVWHSILQNKNVNSNWQQICSWPLCTRQQCHKVMKWKLPELREFVCVCVWVVCGRAFCLCICLWGKANLWLNLCGRSPSEVINGPFECTNVYGTLCRSSKYPCTPNRVPGVNNLLWIFNIFSIE